MEYTKITCIKLIPTLCIDFIQAKKPAILKNPIINQALSKNSNH